MSSESNYIQKIVKYEDYCTTCKHFKELDKSKNPDLENDFCNECLNTPTNINSRKPINYKQI